MILQTSNYYVLNKNVEEKTLKTLCFIEKKHQPYSEYSCTHWHFALGAYVAIATKCVHRLQIRHIVHN